jgi:Short C-terminal domain
MMMRRRRPLAAAAMLGGTAYVAHKAGQAQVEGQYAEADQNARLQALEQQQAAQAPAPAQPAAAPPDPLIAKLQQLADLHTQGVLSDEEFASAKQKLLAG